MEHITHPTLKAHAAFASRMARTRSGRALVALLACCLLLLAACSSGANSSTSGATPTATSKPASPTVPAGTVLFKADWSHGLDGWQATKGWNVKSGYLESDGSNDMAITLPYRPSVASYEVSFELEVVNVPAKGGYFQFAALPQSPRPGYTAMVNNLFPSGYNTSGLHPSIAIMLNPENYMDTSQYQVHDYEPGHDWRTYAVDVRGSWAAFVLNGVRQSIATNIKTDGISNGPLQFQCGIAIVRIKDLTVTAL